MGAVSVLWGWVLLLVYVNISAFAGVYSEYMLKRNFRSSIHVQNIHLYCFGIIANIVMLATDSHNFRLVCDNGFFHGWNFWTAASAMCLGSIGLVISGIMKYADNIVKCFAAALAILAGTLISVPLFGFELSAIFAAGVACTVCASTLYSWAPERPDACGGGGGDLKAEGSELLPLTQRS